MDYRLREVVEASAEMVAMVTHQALVAVAGSPAPAASDRIPQVAVVADFLAVAALVRITMEAVAVDW